MPGPFQNMVQAVKGIGPCTMNYSYNSLQSPLRREQIYKGTTVRLPIKNRTLTYNVHQLAQEASVLSRVTSLGGQTTISSSSRNQNNSNWPQMTRGFINS